MVAKRIKKIIQSSSDSIMDLFDVGPIAALLTLLLVAVMIAVSIGFFIRSAPPSSVTISTGPKGGSYHRIAQKYAKILEEDNVKVNILESLGSQQNLERLKDAKNPVDLAMVQTGLATTEQSKDLVSLGTISQQPLLVFYRGKPMTLLSELKGKKIAIGPEGSGANQLAETLLNFSGVKKDNSTLEEIESDDAAEALTAKKIDAAFIMSESTAFSVLRGLMHSKEIHLYSFTQANAYMRKLDYLNALNIPQGVIDIAANLPPTDVSLIGPTIELIARKDLHPAISDLILDAATAVHARPGLFQQRGEFPNATERSIKISEDASRFYKTGKSFFYRYLPYWLASVISRIVVVFIPTLVVLIPLIKMILSVFRWRVKSRIYKHYRELVNLERALEKEQNPERQAELQKHFGKIESAVNRMRIKGSYADQIYGLRGHIDYVKRHFEQPV